MPNKRECPECHVTLTRYQWSRLWWMSSLMSGRLVQPCAECGAKLRLSAMTLVSSAAAIGLIGAAVAYLFYPSTVLLLAAMALLLVILAAMATTRVEVMPKIPLTDIGALPDRVPKKRQ
jgi:hypothetical protein